MGRVYRLFYIFYINIKGLYYGEECMELSTEKGFRQGGTGKQTAVPIW